MTDTAATTEAPIEEWGVVELFGHVREAGRIAEVDRYGGTMLQLDVLGGEGEISTTQFIGSGAIYRITPCDEATARQAARRLHPPIRRWELETAAAELAAEDLEADREDDEDDVEVPF